MSNKKKIVLFPNVNRDIDLAIMHRVANMLEQYGREIAICPVFDDEMDVFPPMPGFSATNLEDELDNAEMIITFGGDGTILRAARAAAESETPILGINMGGKGFMADLEVAEIELISAAATGAYEIECRMMLETNVVRGAEAVYRDFALNDIVLRGDNKVIDLSLYGDGQLISEFSGDGVIIATPTGSTAYSMAAGGPIVEPSAQNIIITPICAHVLEAKPYVLASDRRVSVEIGYKKHGPAYLSADGGKRVDIFGSDVINVGKSDKCTYLVHLSNRSFYKKVSEKLGEKS